MQRLGKLPQNTHAQFNSEPCTHVTMAPVNGCGMPVLRAAEPWASKPKGDIKNCTVKFFFQNTAPVDLRGLFTFEAKIKKERQKVIKKLEVCGTFFLSFMAKSTAHTHTSLRTPQCFFSQQTKKSGHATPSESVRRSVSQGHFFHLLAPRGCQPL
jgi:hypothetical protein